MTIGPESWIANVLPQMHVFIHLYFQSHRSSRAWPYRLFRSPSFSDTSTLHLPALPERQRQMRLTRRRWRLEPRNCPGIYPPVLLPDEHIWLGGNNGYDIGLGHKTERLFVSHTNSTTRTNRRRAKICAKNAPQRTHVRLAREPCAVTRAVQIDARTVRWKHASMNEMEVNVD